MLNIERGHLVALAKVLAGQALLLFALFFLVWGGQKLYGLIDQTTFPEGYVVEANASSPEPEKGKALLDALTFQIRRELDSTFGWTGNDFLFNKYVLDNRAYRQYGVYVATKVLLDHYSMEFGKLGSSDRENDSLHTARLNNFSINPQKFIFPSAEGAYREGLKRLEQFKAELSAGKASYNGRPDDIYSAFGLILSENVLGYALGLLQNSQDLPSYTLDNRIYEAQGVALVVRDYVRALYTLYPMYAGKNNEENMRVVIKYLDRVATYDPLYISSRLNSGELMISYLLFAKNRLEDIRSSIRI